MSKPFLESYRAFRESLLVECERKATFDLHQDRMPLMSDIFEFLFAGLSEQLSSHTEAAVMGKRVWEQPVELKCWVDKLDAMVGNTTYELYKLRAIAPLGTDSSTLQDMHSFVSVYLSDDLQRATSV